MLGTARPLTFLFRALVLLIAVSILWVNVAEQYNEVLVSLADRLLPKEISTKALGSSVSIDGLALHYGLILLVVLVLASVGLGVVSRAKWLLILGAGRWPCMSWGWPCWEGAWHGPPAPGRPRAPERSFTVYSPSSGACCPRSSEASGAICTGSPGPRMRRPRRPVGSQVPPTRR